ncbi:peptidylprolyl isomerase [Fibrella sp. ES10-3-2-2]|nr:peptidylprolyl isomerase [Fibrella sp. ES10-3-2-2]
MRKLLLLLLLLPLATVAQTREGGVPTFGPDKEEDYLVTMRTDFGIMRFILHDDTPKHKANFIRLVDSSYYDGLLFHRTIEKFMIQGGDPDSRTAVAGQPLGGGSLNYRVPAEFVPNLFHQKGALAAARNERPDKASSSVQFYIVQGEVFDDYGLERKMATSKVRTPDRVFTDEQQQVYKTTGGTPQLDGNYTVFGQVIDGLAVIDSIARQPRDPRNRPLTDIRMTVKGEWVKKQEITKQYGYQFPGRK